ncbi:MAG: GTP 3',8-cyclase MoaA [Armatimonadetes bacterium]|nr:GTP 3',8-cyclase MoaA [Armatimonadota bacterium]
MPLLDRLGRRINNLRISITDRCNFRCVYCMPEEGLKWFPRKDILTYEEIARFVGIASGLGIDKIRLTGGEPLVRKDVPELVRLLKAIPALKDVSLTTNGYSLKEIAGKLYEAGLRRLNISLDTLDAEKYAQITRRNVFGKVMEGIEEARRVGFDPIKINVVAMKGLTEAELVDFAALGREKSYQVRFIEFMPLDADRHWDRADILTAEEIVTGIDTAYPLERVAEGVTAEPATLYRFRDGKGEIGVIASVTEPFCEQCNRVRLTADGKLRTCLFSIRETDFREPLRNGASDRDIAERFRKAVWDKEPGHLINTVGFARPARSMSQIGG